MATHFENLQLMSIDVDHVLKRLDHVKLSFTRICCLPLRQYDFVIHEGKFKYCLPSFFFMLSEHHIKPLSLYNLTLVDPASRVHSYLLHHSLCTGFLRHCFIVPSQYHHTIQKFYRTKLYSSDENRV